MIGSHFGSPVIASQEEPDEELWGLLSACGISSGRFLVSTNIKLLVPLSSVLVGEGCSADVSMCVSFLEQRASLASEIPGYLKSV